MRHSILAVLIAISSVFGVAQASQTETITDDRPQFKSACDLALDGLQSVRDNFDHSDTTTRALLRGAYWDACMAVARSRCGDCDGFGCPSVTRQQIDECSSASTLPTASSTLTIANTEFTSEEIANGIHFVSFEFPMDEFDVDQVNITFNVQDEDEEVSVPSLAGENNALYITNDYMEDGRYTCKPVPFESLDGTVVKPSEIWDGRHRSNTAYGAKTDDVVLLKDIAHCQAWGNQSFTITITEALPE